MGTSGQGASAEEKKPIQNETFLRKRIRDLQAEATQLRVRLESREEHFLAVGAAVAAQEPYPAFRSPKRSKGSSFIVPVLELSDLHIGEVVEADEVEGFNAFNWEIAQAGIFGLLEDFLRWVDVQRKSYPISECVVICKGDYISGDIHDELRVTNEWPLPVQTANAGWLLGEAFRILCGRFKEVTVYEVGADNHGRLQKKPQAKQKYDNSMSRLVHYIANAAAGRCRNFHKIEATGAKIVAPINKKKFLIEHGDNIKGWMGIPFYGVQRQLGKEAVRRMNNDRGFDYYSIGHFHSPCFAQQIIMNGSLSGTSEFDHACGRFADPAQVAYLVHPLYGVFNFTPFLRTDVKKAMALRNANLT